MTGRAIAEFWSAYRRYEGLEHDRFQATWIRTGRDASQSVISAISSGMKCAISAPAHLFGPDGDEPVPVPGEHALLLDHRGQPRLIWRATAVRVAPLADVDEDYLWRAGAFDSGREGYVRDLEPVYGALRGLGGARCDDALTTVFETFEVVWPLTAVRRARLYRPQLRSGLALLRRLQAASDLAAVIERVGTAVITVGCDMRLRTANTAAEALLRRGHGLYLRGGLIAARGRRDHAALTNAVALALSGHGDARTTTDTVLMIGSDGEAPVRLGIFALARGAGGLPAVSEPAALLIASDGAGRTPGIGQELFGRNLGMTAAEARLAAHLADGIDLAAAAVALEITRNTARAHLRSIFAKLGVHRQVELVHLLQSMRGLAIPSR